MIDTIKDIKIGSYYFTAWPGENNHVIKVSGYSNKPEKATFIFGTIINLKTGEISKIKWMTLFNMKRRMKKSEVAAIKQRFIKRFQKF